MHACMHAWRMPGICQGYAKDMPGICHAYAWHMPGICQAYARYMPRNMPRHMPSHMGIRPGNGGAGSRATSPINKGLGEHTNLGPRVYVSHKFDANLLVTFSIHRTSMAKHLNSNAVLLFILCLETMNSFRPSTSRARVVIYIYIYISIYNDSRSVRAWPKTIHGLKA